MTNTTKMELLTQENFGEMEVSFYKDENEDVFMTRNQIGAALEYKNPNDAIRLLHKRHESLSKNATRSHLVAEDGKKYLTTLYNIEGVKKLVSCSKKPQIVKERFLDLLEVSLEKVYIIGYKESETIHLLHTSLNSFSPIKEYKVGKYRVDLCFPEYKLAIECDENNHKHYSQDEEEERQLFIESEGFEFYRYNPDEKGFYMGDIINDILTVLLNKKIKC